VDGLTKDNSYGHCRGINLYHKGSLKSGRCRVGISIICNFNFSNVCCISAVHVNLWCCNKSVREVASVT